MGGAGSSLFLYLPILFEHPVFAGVQYYQQREFSSFFVDFVVDIKEVLPSSYLPRPPLPCPERAHSLAVVTRLLP